MNNSNKIITIIPALNEEDTISQVVNGVKDHLPQSDILLVDDGSSDATSKLAKAGGAKVITLPYNMGYGVALQTGYKYALQKGYHYMVQLDGDGQHDPRYLHALLSEVTSGKVDVAIGSRFSKNSEPYYVYKNSWVKRTGIMLFSFLTSLIIKKKVSDPTSGYQAVNHKVAQFYASEAYPWDYPDADVIIMLHRSGFCVGEVPVVMHQNKNKKSMHSGFKPLYYVFKMFLSIFLTLLRKREPLNQRNERICP